MRRVITPDSPTWPPQLDALGKGAPKQLHIEGDDLVEKERCVAIVGTREASLAGLNLARSFAGRLAEAGYVVVSGLARGIDSAAHRGAIDAGGRTIAVMGCGLSMTYPPRNKVLREQIAQAGSVLSEYEDEAEPHSFHFPQRNRIIAGLARGVIVIEGGIKSGALITARIALDINRDVYAVPGAPGDPRSAGPNALIREGEAALVTEAKHVFEDIAPQVTWDSRYMMGARPVAIPGPEELVVLQSLSSVPVTPDELMRVTGLPSGQVALSLSKLEVRGLAQSLPGGAYRLSEGGERVLHLTLNGGGALGQ